jgi:hypothetical protein
MRLKNAHALVFLFLVSNSLAMQQQRRPILPLLAIPTAQYQKTDAKQEEVVAPERSKTASPDSRLAMRIQSQPKTKKSSSPQALSRLSKTVSMPNLNALTRSSTPPTPLSPFFNSPPVYMQKEYDTFCRAQNYAGIMAHLVQRVMGVHKIKVFYSDSRPCCLRSRNKKTYCCLWQIALKVVFI